MALVNLDVNCNFKYHPQHSCSRDVTNPTFRATSSNKRTTHVNLLSLCPATDSNKRIAYVFSFEQLVPTNEQLVSIFYLYDQRPVPTNEQPATSGQFQPTNNLYPSIISFSKPSPQMDIGVRTIALCFEISRR